MNYYLWNWRECYRVFENGFLKEFKNYDDALNYATKKFGGYWNYDYQINQFTK